MVDNEGMRQHAVKLVYLQTVGADPVVPDGERPPSLKVHSAQGITTFSGLTVNGRAHLDQRLDQIRSEFAEAEEQ